MQLLHAHVLRGVVSEETVVLCRWGSSRQKFGFINRVDNKHLMTGPKGNSDCGFPETLNVPRGEAEGNIEVEGKQNSLFPEGPVIKCFVIPPNSK